MNKDGNCFIDLNTLNRNDWSIFIWIKTIFKPFYFITKYLEDNAIDGTCDILKSVMIDLEYLVNIL